MTSTSAPDLDDIEETEFAILQRDRLNQVLDFLVAHDADDDLVEAVEQALEDNDRWLSTDTESFIEETLSPGSATQQ
jgi:hypothetical protein